MNEPRRYDDPEVLTRGQLEELQAQLSKIGPWYLAVGTGGILRAERGGTIRFEQAAITADGLLKAVREAEARQQQTQATPILDGVGNTSNIKEAT